MALRTTDKLNSGPGALRLGATGVTPLATAITGDELRAAVESESFIKDGEPACAEGVKYDFRLGTRILKATFRRPVDMAKMPETEQGSMTIDPGEVVFVLSEESLDLPSNVMAVLSPKRKLSHEGIMVLGGLCIDPLYRGKLLVGMHNFSTSPYPLIPGKKLIAAVFYRLEGDEIDKFSKPSIEINDFPEDLVKLIEKYKPVALIELQNTLSETKKELQEIKNEIKSGRDWQKEFRNALEQHNSQIGQLANNLEKETENRKESEKSFRDDLRDMQKLQLSHAVRLSFIVGLTVLIVGGLAAYLIPKAFGS